MMEVLVPSCLVSDWTKGGPVLFNTADYMLVGVCGLADIEMVLFYLLQFQTQMAVAVQLFCILKRHLIKNL